MKYYYPVTQLVRSRAQMPPQVFPVLKSPGAPLFFLTASCVCVSCLAWVSMCWTLCDLVDSLWPVRLFCPWNSAGKNTGVGCLSFCRRSSWPRGRTQVSYIAGIFFTIWAIGKSPTATYWLLKRIPLCLISLKLHIQLYKQAVILNHHFFKYV